MSHVTVLRLLATILRRGMLSNDVIGLCITRREDATVTLIITSDKLEMLKFKYGRTSSRTVKKGLESSKLRGSANIRLGNHPGQNIN